MQLAKGFFVAVLGVVSFYKLATGRDYLSQVDKEDVVPLRGIMSEIIERSSRNKPYTIEHDWELGILRKYSGKIVEVHGVEFNKNYDGRAEMSVKESDGRIVVSIEGEIGLFEWSRRIGAAKQNGVELTADQIYDLPMPQQKAPNAQSASAVPELSRQ